MFNLLIRRTMTVYWHCDYYYALTTRPLYCVYVLFMLVLLHDRHLFLSFLFQWSALISNDSRAQQQSQGKMCVCVCKCVWERVCNWLHVTVCDPWLGLSLYITPATRIGHDLKQGNSIHAIFLMMFLSNIPALITSM